MNSSLENAWFQVNAIFTEIAEKEIPPNMNAAIMVLPKVKNPRVAIMVAMILIGTKRISDIPCHAPETPVVVALIAMT